MTEQAAPKQTMATQEVTIKLQGSALNPPIYVAGSFTKEPWSLVVMDVGESEWNNEGEMIATTFSKTFNLRPGEYQYKFRLGDGDWWICDEDSEIVKDDSGNSNNCLTVHPIQDEETKSSINGTAKDRWGVNPSNYWLPKIVSPQLEASSEHNSVAGNGIHFLPNEMALGTWEPGQELSPMHRRASTSLGVRISRMGTFIPPSEEEAKEPEGHAKDEPKASDDEDPPETGQQILARMRDMAEQAGDGHHYVGLDGSYVGPRSGRNRRFGTRSERSKIKSKGRREFMVNLDSILEVSPESYAPILGAAHPDDAEYRVPTVLPSYGTMNTIMEHVGTQDISIINGKPASPLPQPFIEPTNLSIPLAADGSASDRPSESITDYKEENANKHAPKGFALFAVLAAWVRGIWKRLLGGLKKKDQKAEEAAHI